MRCLISKLLFISCTMGVTTAAVAYESHELRRCVFRECVQTYYMCDRDDGDDNCKPRLDRSQKEVLEAYHLCKDVGQGTCRHEGISDAIMKKLTRVQGKFNQCKLTCYKRKSPDLYARVFDIK